jgi:hypothetical protein
VWADNEGFLSVKVGSACLALIEHFTYFVECLLYCTD